MATKKLTAAQVRAAKPRDKQYKLSDGEGLVLLVLPDGRKRWVYRYRWRRKENNLGLGVFPEVDLAQARELKREKRDLLREGVNPSDRARAIRETKPATFGELAEDWFQRKSNEWTRGHARTVRSRLDRDLLPYLGDAPAADLRPLQILGVLRLIEQRGAIETMHRCKTIVGQVLRYGIPLEVVDRDVTADLRDALPSPQPSKMAAITKPAEVGELMRAIDGYRGFPVVRCALRLIAYTFVRPGELRAARWSEFELDRALWIVPAERMKARREHLVPLSRQSISILHEIEPLTRHCSEFVFPTPRTNKRCLSNNALLAALRRLGYQQGSMTAHGFRSTASTLCREALQVRGEVIETQLAHRVGGVEGTYNRAEYLPERFELMQRYADYLDDLKG